MIAGCYVLDLYCRNQGKGCPLDRGGNDQAKMQFNAHNQQRARFDARRAGWKFIKAKPGESGDCLCPKCAEVEFAKPKPRPLRKKATVIRTPKPRHRAWGL